MSALQGRVAIVTGGARGIGRAIAERLSIAGAAVVVVDTNGEGARLVAERVRGLAVEADVSQEADTQRIVDVALAEHGKVDVLVHAAAIAPYARWDAFDYPYWQKVIRVNLDGTYLMGRAVERPMRATGYGRIVNIASNAFFAGTKNMGPYIAAKGGIIGLTRVQATELGPYGITANAVAPGITATEGTLATPHRESFDAVQALQAIARHGVPADIAPAVAFLASEESHWITGQTLVVDAGHVRD